MANHVGTRISRLIKEVAYLKGEIAALDVAAGRALDQMRPFAEQAKRLRAECRAARHHLSALETALAEEVDLSNADIRAIVRTPKQLGQPYGAYITELVRLLRSADGPLSTSAITAHMVGHFDIPKTTLVERNRTRWKIRQRLRELEATRRPEKIAETSYYDESASFHHWQLYFFAKCGVCDSDNANIRHFLNNYTEYCAARGGQWSVGGMPLSGTCSGPKPFDVKVSVYSKRNEAVSSDRLYYLLVDAFDRKEGTSRAVGDEYRTEQTTRTNNSYNLLDSNLPIPLQFRAYTKRDLPAEQAARERERAERAAAEVARKNEQAVRQSVAEATYLPKTTSIGQRVCRFYKGHESHQTSMGYQYATIDLPFRVTAFTEKVSGDKVQIRIGSIETIDAASGRRKNIDRLGGNLDLKPGMLVWDDAIEWKPCN